MIRVMVVDDSALVRRIASDILTADPEITVVATAAQAEFALPKLDRGEARRHHPRHGDAGHGRPGGHPADHGRPADAHHRAQRPRPEGRRAHAAGARPRRGGLRAEAFQLPLRRDPRRGAGAHREGEERGPKIVFNPAPPRPLGHRRARREQAAVHAPSPSRPSASPRRRARAGSTSWWRSALPPAGPVALKTVLTMLPGDLPVGIVVVQHMPPVFTKAFAERLDSCCEVAVKEAENGDAIIPGRVLLAPGNWHMTVSRFGVRAARAPQPGRRTSTGTGPRWTCSCTPWPWSTAAVPSG